MSVNANSSPHKLAERRARMIEEVKQRALVPFTGWCVDGSRHSFSKVDHIKQCSLLLMNARVFSCCSGHGEKMTPDTAILTHPFLRNFEGLVISCIDTSDSKSRRIFQHFSRSTRVSHLCTASGQKFALFCNFSLIFPECSILQNLWIFQ